MVICAWLTDKYISSIKIFNIGVAGLVIFSISLYYIMSNGIIELIIIAQLIMTIFLAMIMCNVADKIVTAADGQTTTLSIGFNFTAIFVGGLTLLIISYLSGFNLIYVGMFLALFSLTVLLSSKLSSNISLQ
ncbi:sensor histidine kinase YesM [Providencia alcalifaciens]|nr:sensor histidine kinase YesM [Providencia alcalifaciens]